jgi:hypothetical protein
MKKLIIGIAAPENVLVLPSDTAIRICSAGKKWDDFLAARLLRQNRPASRAQPDQLKSSGRKRRSGSGRLSTLRPV